MYQFKVGDKIKCVRLSDNYARGNGYKLGSTYTIKSLPRLDGEMAVFVSKTGNINSFFKSRIYDDFALANKLIYVHKRRIE